MTTNSLQFWLVLVILIALSSVPILALAQQPLVGTVDVRLLMVLHPRMATFDYIQKRFFRPQNQAQARTSKAQAIKDAQANIEQDLKRLNAEVERLRRNQEDLLKRREATLNSLQENAKSSSGIRDWSTQFREYVERYQRLISENDRQLKEAEKNLAKLQEKAYSPIYLNEAETKTQLRQIFDEVQKYIEMIAKEKQLVVVFDPNLNQHEALNSNYRVIPPAPPPPYDFGPRLIQTMQTNEAPYYQPLIPGPDGKLIDAAAHVAQARGESLIRTVRKYLNLMFYLSLARRDIPLFQNFILMGGSDITPLVLQRMLQAYKIDPAIQSKIMKLLTSYQMAYQKH